MTTVKTTNKKRKMIAIASVIGMGGMMMAPLSQAHGWSPRDWFHHHHHRACAQTKVAKAPQHHPRVHMRAVMEKQVCKHGNCYEQRKVIHN